MNRDLTPTPDDSEAVAWAYKKLCAFGCENGKPDTVEMMDRLKLMLLGQTVAQSESTRRIPNIDHLTVQELQSLAGLVNLLLQHKVCGDPSKGFTV